MNPRMMKWWSQDKVDIMPSPSLQSLGPKIECWSNHCEHRTPNNTRPQDGTWEEQKQFMCELATLELEEIRVLEMIWGTANIRKGLPISRDWRPLENTYWYCQFTICFHLADVAPGKYLWPLSQREKISPKAEKTNTEPCCSAMSEPCSSWSPHGLPGRTAAEKLVSRMGREKLCIWPVFVWIQMTTSLFPFISKGFSVIKLSSTPFLWKNLCWCEIEMCLF